MQNRIKNLFKNHQAFVGYLTIGDGSLERSQTAAQALIAGGVNLLELGVPFSDPVADGPVIQRAAQRALDRHTSLSDVLTVAKKLREHNNEIPMILFSYFNPLLQANPDRWLPQAKAAGIDGVLVVDLPHEEGADFYKQCLAHDILPVPVVTPATTPQRLKQLARHAKGFLYYASRKGTTGVRSGLPADFAPKLAEIKQHTDLPVVAGFGIASATDAKEVLRHADGFVVGSLFVKAVEEGASIEELTKLARGLL